MESLSECGIDLETLLDSIPDVILVVSEKAEIVFANHMVETIFGYSANELVSRPLDMLLTEQARETHGKHIVQYMAQPRIRRMGEGKVLFARHKNGTVFPVEVSLGPTRTSGGLLVTATVRDASQRVNTEKLLQDQARELMRSNRDLEQFVYIASHDLQEPLRTISSFVQLLAKRYQGKLGKDADDFIDFIVDGTHRMQALINDLLQYSRMNRQEQRVHSVDCNVVAENALKNLGTAIRESNAHIEYSSLPTVMGHEGQLVQLLQNVIGNAIKYRKPETAPEIRIEVRENASDFQFSIHDNGIGIAPEYHERIFAVFQRLHSRKQYSGTGIGLALCKRIVENHGGKIWVESQSDQGSTFHFTLPKSSTNFTNNLHSSAATPSVIRAN